MTFDSINYLQLVVTRGLTHYSVAPIYGKLPAWVSEYTRYRKVSELGGSSHAYCEKLSLAEMETFHIYGAGFTFARCADLIAKYCMQTVGIVEMGIETFTK